MDTQQTDHKPGKKEILFPNGNRAQLVAPTAGAPPAFILKELNIKQPKALIIVVGGAAGLDEALKPHLVQLFSRGIACAAADTGALIIDGGTQAGVMEMIGRGVVDCGRKSVLLGVAPGGKVTYPGGPLEGSIEDGASLNPNHSHFVLVKSNEWGGETETMYELATFMSAHAPSLVLLANGGLVARDEILRNVRERREIIVIKGSGRLADEIAGAMAGDYRTPDAEIAAIVRYDRITLFDIEEGPEALATLIRQKLFQEPAARVL